MPKDWPARGAEGPGRRGAVVRAREHRQEPRLRPLRGRAQPGLLRRRGRAPRDDGGGAGDPRRGAQYEGKVATTFYYSSSGGRTASSRTSSVSTYPYLQARRRSVGRGLAAPPLATEARYRRRARAARSGSRLTAVDVVVVPTPSGRPRIVTLVTETGDVRGAARGRRPRAARAALHRVQDRRPPDRAPPPAPVSRDAVTSRESPATSTTPSSRSSVPAGPGLQAAKVAPQPTARSPSPSDPKATATYRLIGGGLPGPAAHGHRRPRTPADARAPRAPALQSHRACCSRVAGAAALRGRRRAGADRAACRERFERRRRRRVASLAPIPALVVDAPSARRSAGLPGVALRRAAATPPAGVHAQRPVPRPPVVRRAEPRVRRLDGAATARAGARRGDRLGCRRHASRARARGSPRPGASSAARARRHAGSRDVRRRVDRGAGGQRRRDRRPRAVGRAARRQGRRRRPARSRSRRRRRRSAGRSARARA